MRGSSEGLVYWCYVFWLRAGSGPFEDAWEDAWVIWFTSDTHFNHENIIRYCDRPFDSIEEMTEEFVEAWNGLVWPGHTVYHLGDFAISYGKKHEGVIDSILSRLDGQKHLIVGNHDRKEVINSRHWVSVQHYKEIKVDLGGEHKQRIVMSHYPLRSWNQMHRGSWMLHGHCHGNLSDIGGKIIDVGVDCMAFRPISLASVQLIMDSRPSIVVDHHVDM